jgi:hypothetical protein
VCCSDAFLGSQLGIFDKIIVSVQGILNRSLGQECQNT